MYHFTSSQWRELEQQALIFKYLACGLPIPSDLIMQIKKSFLLDISIGPTRSFAFLSPHTQTPTSFSSPDGWGSVQTGFGRRTEDPEPGRCRRTDGKKWRCSREACGDSKYCERHMHRGKNRSRKLVELSLATHTSNVYPSSSSISSSSSSSSSSPYSPYSSLKNPNSIDSNHKDGAKIFKDQYENRGNGFWFMSESNLKPENLTIDLALEEKQNQFVVGSNLIRTESAEKPRSFHCFFD